MLRRVISRASSSCRLFTTDANREALQSLSGIPKAYRNVPCRIYSPAKNAMQSGGTGKSEWVIQFQPGDKWVNPLMGWVSSADPMGQVSAKMSFPTKQEAVEFAESNGWQITIEEPNQVERLPKAYSTNFAFKPLPEEL